METITDELELKRAGFCWRTGDAGVRALVCEPLEGDGFANAFSTRAGGVSSMPHSGALNLAGFSDDSAENINENRRRFFQVLGGEWTFSGCWQIHSAEVRVVKDAADPLSEEEHCDALATCLRGVLLGIKTADCVPVLLADTRTGACAAAHAGWRGTLAEIVRRTLARMDAEFGTRAPDVRACIGAAALGCCYEVGAEVIEAFHEKFPRADGWFEPTREGHALVDLQRANRDQLIESGVHDERIHALPLCTMCRTDLFFSYRRDRSVYGKTGRLLSVIGRRAE